MTEHILRTPLKKIKAPSNTFTVVDADNSVVAFHLTDKEADEIILRCNAHDGLVEALETIRRQSSKMVNAGHKEEVRYFNIAEQALAKPEKVSDE